MQVFRNVFADRVQRCLCILVCSFLACARQEQTDSRATRGVLSQDLDPKQVVSWVSGAPILLAEVEALAVGAGKSAREALRLLEEQTLLAQRAERLGFAERRSVVRGTDQALVQRILETEIESKVTPQSIAMESIQEAYEKQKTRFSAKERRASSHVLVRLGVASPELEAEAKQYIESILAAMTLQTPDVVMIQQSMAKHPRFTIVAEGVPPLSRDDAADEAYKKALFSLDQPGIVTTPIRSSFGWHAIVLSEIMPAKNETLSEAEPLLRKELITAERKKRLEAWVRELKSSLKVTINSKALDWIGSADFDKMMPP